MQSSLTSCWMRRGERRVATTWLASVRERLLVSKIRGEYPVRIMEAFGADECMLLDTRRYATSVFVP